MTPLFGLDWIWWKMFQAPKEQFGVQPKSPQASCTTQTIHITANSITYIWCNSKILPYLLQNKILRLLPNGFCFLILFYFVLFSFSSLLFWVQVELPLWLIKSSFAIKIPQGIFTVQCSLNEWKNTYFFEPTVFWGSVRIGAADHCSHRRLCPSPSLPRIWTYSHAETWFLLRFCVKVHHAEAVLLDGLSDIMLLMGIFCSFENLSRIFECFLKLYFITNWLACIQSC